MKKSFCAFLLVAIFVISVFAGCTPTDNPEPKPDTSTVAFSVTSTAVYVGETYQTELTGLAEGETVTAYHSNNQGVATVSDSGLVTAVSAGNATIKVTTNKGGQALLRVEVLSADMVYVPYIALSATEVTLQSGDRYAIDYSVTYMGKAIDVAVQWTSSDSNVATVDNGVITAKGNGDCAVEAKCSYNNAEGTAHITVSVGSAGIALTTSIDNRELYVKEVVDLYLYVTDNGQTVTPDNVTFTSANADVAKVDGTTLTAVAGGNVEITATFTYNGEDYSITRNLYVYGYRVVTIRANGRTDSTVRGVVYGDKVTLKLKTPVTGRDVKCWYVDGERIDGNTFVMPDKNVVCEAKLTNQTEGNFTTNFANGTLFTEQITYEFVSSSLKDRGGNDVTDGNYVSLDSVTSQSASVVYNFDESVAVTDSASITLRIKLSGGARLYLGTATVVKCVAAVSTKSETVVWKQDVADNTWTEIRIPLTTFAASGNFLSSVSLAVNGVVYVDYINVNY